MNEEIKKLNHKPRLVLHVCCAPCCSGVFGRLKQYFNIEYYYFNPNIYPKTEFDLRAKQFEKLGVEIEVEKYNHQQFLNAVAGKENELEGGTRCQECIALRMEQSFKHAVEVGAEYITTTLSVSPHKDAEFINKCGECLSAKYGVKYLYADFKKENGYLTSTQVSKQLGMYRQTYCGCEFSLKKGKEE